MRCTCLITLFLATSTGALAQVGPGDRVRVTTPELERYDGTVQAMEGDTLTVDTLRLAVATVTKLDLHLGSHSEIDKGAAVGAALGALAGLLIGRAQDRGSPPQCGIGQVFCGYEKTLTYGLVGFALGVAAGALVGSALKTDEWWEMPLDRLRVNVAPQRDGGFAFGLSVAF